MIDEPYLASGMATEMPRAVTVPKGQMFVMGDNRINSADSRAYGPVPIASIEGYVRVSI